MQLLCLFVLLLLHGAKSAIKGECPGHQDNSVEKKESFQQMVLKRPDFHMQKNEVELLPPTMYENNPK